MKNLARGRLTLLAMLYSGWSGDNALGIPALPLPANFGIWFMGTTGYALMFDSINFGNTIKLCRMPNSFSFSTGSALGSDYIQLATTSTAAFFNNRTATIIVQWYSDPTYLRGTWIQCYKDSVGAATKIFDFVHTGSDAIASSTSSGEGIYVHGNETNTGQASFFNMTCYTLQNITINDMAVA